ncbi:MAG TPA: hypothetical protein VEO91_02335 [Candidatus Limnocylindria bacterium]|nr:hypothetical protein [Candidatus Limnocylindria bacterium]
MRILKATGLSMALAGALLVGLAPGVAAGNSSCTAQFTSALAPVVRPFGQNIVVPEVRNLTLGGPNLGQEVMSLFATADRTACPVPPG